MASVDIDINVIAKKALSSLQNLEKQAERNNSGFNSLGKSIIVFNQGLALAGKAYRTLSSLFNTVKGAAQVQEDAVNALNIALADTTDNVGEASERFQKFASELQKTTKYGDEVTIQAGAMLTQLTKLTGQGLENGIVAAQNMASAIGVDLNTAVRLIAKSMEDGGSGLKRYNVAVEQGANKSDTLANAINAVNSKFGGAAQGQINTYSGATQQLSNAFGDVLENVGMIITKNPEVIEAIKSTTIVFEKLGNYIIDNSAKISSGISSFVNALAGLTGISPVAKLKTEIEQLQQTNAKFEETLSQGGGWFSKLLFGGEGSQKEKLLAQIEENEELILEKQAEIDEIERLADEKKIERTDNKHRVLIEKEKGFFDSFKSELGKRQKFEELTDKERVDNFKSTMGSIATLSQSGNKALAAIGKSAAITTATIDGIAGVQKAWALGPILGPPLAALVGVATAANVAKIAGIPLAEGGVVQARPGGVAATIGEAGRNEAVIPLDDERAQRQMGGLGGMTVIIQGNVIGDDEHIDQLARQLSDAVRFRNVELRASA